MKHLLILLLGCIGLSSLAQEARIYDDLVIDVDSTTKAYKPKGKNYAFIKSKRGTGGVARTKTADSIVGLTITDIVMVSSEYYESAIAKREEASRERWDNLLLTYPQLCQFETNYLNLYQISRSLADTLTFKPAAGIYVYFKAKEKEVVKEEPKKTEEKRTEDVADNKKSKKSKNEEAVEEKPKKEEKAKKEKPVKEEKPKKEEVAKKEKEKEKEEVAEPEVKEVKEKKVGYTKPRKAKDIKACRPPCYEGGDEDLFAFFKENIKLTKKQKRHSGDLVAVLRLQLNFDGSIKKHFIQGTNEEFNKQVEEAVNAMNLWNPAVKGGVTVKSEIKFTLKYDHDTHAIKPFETTITPRPGPKCVCVPDSEILVD